MTGEILASIQVAIMDTTYWSVCSSSMREVVGEEGSLFWPASSFTLFGYKIIWCKIQVIINLGSCNLLIQSYQEVMFAAKDLEKFWPY